MKNIVVNIVRGAWGWRGLGVTNGPKGCPGASLGMRLSRRREHKFGLGSAPGPLWVCVWILRTSPGSSGGTLETFWELLGSSGSTFWEHFLSEKQFFAILNRKTYAKRVSTSRSIQSVLFQTTFEKESGSKNQ